MVMIHLSSKTVSHNGHSFACASILSAWMQIDIYLAGRLCVVSKFPERARKLQGRENNSIEAWTFPIFLSLF
jgi:hypothetical protein